MAWRCIRGVVLSSLPWLVLLALWAWISAVGLIRREFLPSPVQTAQAFVALLDWNFLRLHVMPSFMRVTLALLISSALAVPAGIACGRVEAVRRFLAPLFAYARYIPIAALVPLCILWFGLDDVQKIAVITLGVVFPLILLVASATAAVPASQIEAALVFGLSPREILTRVVLPSAMPTVWDHLRVAAGWAWSYVVLAELIAGNTGLGYLVVQSQRYLQIERAFAIIAFITIVGLATDVTFLRIGKRLFPWV